MFRSFLQFLTATLVLLVACMNTATAKPTTPEPDGIQVGGFILHPGADVSVSYDFQTTDRYGTTKDGLVDVGVHLNTKLANEETKSWDNKIGVMWEQYWGIGNQDPQGGINLNISTNADLFKKSFFRIAPSASYTYVTEPEDANLVRDYKNHNVSAGSVFTFQPGEGAIFSERIAYNFVGHFYDDRSDINNMAHRIESLTRWNFLPNTSMSLMVDFRITHFLEDERGNERDGIYENSTSYPVRIKYSLQGLLLARLSYILGAGYSYVYYTNGLKEHMFIMNARIKYEFTDYISLALDYRKDFENVVYGDYYKYHRVGLTFDALWFNHLQTQAELGYGGYDFITNYNARKDNLFSVKGVVNYYIFPGMKLGLEYKLRYNNSDLAGAGYIRHQALFNIGYEY